MNKPVYKLFYKDGSLNISDLVDTRETVITRQLCTTEFKSAIDKASIVVRYSSEKTALRQNILDYLYGSMETLEDITLKITLDEYSLFTGNLDLSELKLSSKRLPESINLEAKDVSAKLLDRKVDDYIIYEKKTISQIVTALIKHAGGTFLHNNIKTIDDRVIPVFAIDREDDDGTYREYIDTLLFEAGGYVLDTDENGKMSIIALPWESYEPTATVDDYLLDKGVVTTRKIFDKTGLKLTWSTLSETGKNQRVWSGDFSRNIQNGKPVGIDIPSGTYYPQNGDIEPTYQQFSADFLDREYLTHQRRDKNKDLSVIAVRDVTAQIVALDSKGNRLDNTKVWDFPILPSLGMAANPTIYAKKAWYLLKNKYADTVNLQFFTLEGRVLYRSKINHLTIPATAQKLEEYTSQYIFSDEHAKRFSQFYWHYLKYSSTIHKWSVLGDVSLGDVVKVLHKGASAAQASIIVSESLHFVGNTSKVDCVAVALGKYNEYPVKAWTDSGNVAPPVPVPEAPKHLTVDVFPSAVSYYADNYSVDENAKIKVTVNAENIKESINVSWNGGSTVLPVSGGVFEIPVSSLTKVDVLSVSATANGIISSASVAKSFRTGKVNLHSSKNLFEFYADNIPHDEKDLITVECLATGFKNIPSVYLDGVAMQMNPDRTYTIPVSAIKNKDALKVEAKIAGFYDFLTIQKIKDIPTLNMTLSGTQFFYSADNVPHDMAAQIHVAVKTSGIFEKPILKIDGVIEPLSPDQTCIIPTGRMEGELKLNLEATCFTLSRTAEINKVIDVPTVGLSLTSDHFTYYADNVVREGQPDIIATATSTGIARGLKLTVNGNEFALNDAGQALIPSTVLDGNAEFVDVKVEPRHIVTISDIRRIKKEYMTPSLTLLTDAGQFAFDINGMPSPEVIHLEYRTEGLSSAVVPSVKVQNQPRQWISKSIDVSYLEIVSLNLIRVVAEIERFNLKREIVINKVNDSKAIIPIIEYAYGPSITEPPEAEWLGYEDHALAYGDMRLIYDAGWTSSRPELVPENKPYLWMRISVDNRETYSYSPLTGPKGDNGKDGMQNVYCGAKTVHPALRPDGTPLIPGDYYLDIRDTTAPVPYILQENGVWRLVATTDPEWSAIASVTREDVLALGSVLKTTSAYYAFFAMLSANNGYIDNLGAQDIIMKRGGSIQSENYYETDGIEGWKIDSEGNSDFRNGTWRGSFANGLVFNAPTECDIDKNMSQRDAFKLMKKAGIGEGVYNGPLFRNSQSQRFAIRKNNPGEWPFGAFDDTPFSCMDYDSSKVNFNIPITITGDYVAKFRYPIMKFNPETKEWVIDESQNKYSSFPISFFGPLGAVMPFTYTSYIIVLFKYDPLTEYRWNLDGYYLLKQSGLETILNTDLKDLPPDIKGARLHQDLVISDYEDRMGKYAEADKFFGYMKNLAGLVKIPELEEAFLGFAEAPAFFLYPAVTDNANYVFFDSRIGDGHGVKSLNVSLDSDGMDYRKVSYSFGNYEADGLELHIAPYFAMNNIRVEGNTIYFFLSRGADNSGKFLKLSAEKTFDVVPSADITVIDVPVTDTSEWEKNTVIGGVTVNHRTFGFITMLEEDFYDGNKTFYKFAELTNGQVRAIPNDNNRWRLDYDKGGVNYLKDNAVISNFLVKNGFIYGHIRGTTFRYEIATDKYYDMTIDLVCNHTIEAAGAFASYTGHVSILSGTMVKDRNGVEPLETSCAITSIEWDKKENAILFNYKTAFRWVDDDFQETYPTPPSADDFWICTPVYYYPETNSFKVFATSTAQRMIGGNNPSGMFTLLANKDRRLFAADNGVLFFNGYNFNIKEKIWNNPTINELDIAAMNEDDSVLFDNITVYDEFTHSPMYRLAYTVLYIYSNPTLKYLDNGLDSLSMSVPFKQFKSKSPFSVFSRRIIVREIKDGYELAVPTITLGFRGQGSPGMGSDSPFPIGLDGYIKCDKMVPFLTIRKDSMEPVGASFTWRFPAQLTTTEDVGPVLNMLAQYIHYQN